MQRLKYWLSVVVMLTTGLGLFIMIPRVLAGVGPTTPPKYVVTVYKTELSTKTDDTDWVTVFDNPDGTIIDLTGNDPLHLPGTAFGQGAIPEGIYKSLRITIKNALVFSDTLPAFIPYPGDETLHVPVYFCTAGTFSWTSNGLTIGTAFPLPDPIRVVADATSKIILKFNVSNSLIPDGGSYYLNPPVISVSTVVINTGAPPGSGFQGGEYYFVRQNIRFPVVTETDIAPTWLALESGWGTISLSPVTVAEGGGTFQITEAYTNGRNIQNNGLAIGGNLTSDPVPIPGKYYVDADGYINMLMPQTQGIIRGAVRNDGKVFIAIEIATPSSNTSTDAWIGYHMIYALRKETNTLGYLNGDMCYNSYATQINKTEYTATSLPAPNEYQLSYDTSIGWVNGSATDFINAETVNRLEIYRPLSPAAYGQLVQGPYVSSYGPDISGTCLTINPDGTFSGGDALGYVLNDGTLALLGGSQFDPTDVDVWGSGPTAVTATMHYLSFGIVMKQSVSGTWNTANVAGTYSFVYKGDYWENSMGTALPDNEVLLGRITFDGQGNVSGHAIRCKRGTIEIETISETYEVIVDKIGAITGTVGTDCIETDVLWLHETADPSDPGIKMLICSDGLTLAPYAPPGTPGTPSTYNNDRGLGLAIKQR